MIFKPSFSYKQIFGVLNVLASSVLAASCKYWYGGHYLKISVWISSNFPYFDPLITWKNCNQLKIFRRILDCLFLISNLVSLWYMLCIYVYTCIHTCSICSGWFQWKVLGKTFALISVLWTSTWFILMNVSCTLEDSMCSKVIWYSALWISE